MVSYKPLWHTLLSHDMKKMDLVGRGVVSRATLAKMGRDEYVALEVIDRICSELGCPIEAVVEVKRAQGWRSALSPKGGSITFYVPACLLWCCRFWEDHSGHG